MNRSLPALLAALALVACGNDDAADAPGVDAEARRIAVGELLDLTGPVSEIAVPWGEGKRLAFADASDPEHGLLPDGWQLVPRVRDHGYEPKRSLEAFRDIRNDVLFIGTSFGTPNTTVLRPELEAAQMMAFPASLASHLQAFPYTPPFGPSYYLESLRALDFIAEDSGSGQGVRLGLVYQDDDYGQDALDAVNFGAPRQHMRVVARISYQAGSSDFAQIAERLQDVGATHVLLATVPGATAAILGHAARAEYFPMWFGNSASWVDRFFRDVNTPQTIFQKFYLISGLPFWGEASPLFDRFEAARERHGNGDVPRDTYALIGYFNGMLQAEVSRRMIASGDISRQGFINALRGMRDFDAFGALPQPLDFSTTPFSTGSQTRVLAPNFQRRSWTVISDYAAPSLPH